MNRKLCAVGVLQALLLLSCLLSVRALETVSVDQGAVGVLRPFWNVTYGGPRADEGWGVAVDGQHNA